jgi:hypothetical protein
MFAFPQCRHCGHGHGCGGVRGYALRRCETGWSRRRPHYRRPLGRLADDGHGGVSTPRAAEPGTYRGAPSANGGGSPGACARSPTPGAHRAPAPVRDGSGTPRQFTCALAPARARDRPGPAIRSCRPRTTAEGGINPDIGPRPLLPTRVRLPHVGDRGSRAAEHHPEYTRSGVKHRRHRHDSHLRQSQLRLRGHADHFYLVIGPRRRRDRHARVMQPGPQPALPSGGSTDGLPRRVQPAGDV